MATMDEPITALELKGKQQQSTPALYGIQASLAGDFHYLTDIQHMVYLLHSQDIQCAQI